MRALVGAELLKLRTRTTAGLLLATLALVGLTTTVSVPQQGAKDPAVPLSDSSVLASVVGSSFGVPEVLIVLLGTLAFTQEFRYGTVTSTYLGEPRRSRILAAKLISLAMLGVVATVGTLVIAIPLGAAVIDNRHGNVALGARLWQTLLAALVVMAAYAVIGVSLGALIRSQVGAVVAVLVWMLAVEYVVVPSWPAVGQWFPLGVASSLLQLGPTLGLEDELLPPGVATFVLLAYTALALALALRFTPRRDVL